MDRHPPSLASVRQASRHKRVVALCIRIALAYAGLAEAYDLIGYWGFLPPKEAFPEAKRAAQKALDLDSDLAEAHTALAYTQFQYEWKFKEAEREFREAIRLDPNSADARLGLWEYPSDFGQVREAQEQLEHARELDPLSVRISFNFAAESFFERDFDRALEGLEKTISMDPNNAIAYDLLGAIFYQKRMPAQTVTAWEKVKNLEDMFSSEEMTGMWKAYETGGLSAYLRKENEFRQKRLAEGKYQSSVTLALNYAIAGDDSEALEWLEKAVEERTPWLPELKIDPNYDGLRSQPRFIALLKRIGLEK
jgi:adenylate cyclase